MLILCVFCAIFAPNGPNLSQNGPKTAEFPGKMRFFCAKVAEKSCNSAETAL